MAKNLVHDGHRVTVTLGADASSGDVIAVGDLIGVVLSDGLSGQQAEVALSGVWNLPRAAADTFAVGDEVGLTGGEIVAIGTGSYAMEAQAPGTGTVATLINGMPGAGG